MRISLLFWFANEIVSFDMLIRDWSLWINKLKSNVDGCFDSAMSSSRMSMTSLESIFCGGILIVIRSFSTLYVSGFSLSAK